MGSPRSGALAPTAATSTGCDSPKRPSSSRVHRKREFGGAALSGCGDNLSSKPDAGISSDRKASRSGPGADGSSDAMPRAGIDARTQVASPGPAMRMQCKLRLTGRLSRTTRIGSRRGGPPTGSVAARRRRRRANGPSPPISRASSASQSLAPNRASIAGLAFTRKPAGKRSASRALPLSHSCGASCLERRSGSLTRKRRGVGGGRWRRVGQVGAREWTSDRRSHTADDLGFIVSESLTRP